MKFWQFLAVFRDESEILTSSFSKDKWKRYLNMYDDIENIIRKQQREILDANINDELLFEVCLKSKKIIYWLPSKNKIYSYKNEDSSIEVPIARAVALFSHDSIEEVFEKSESDVADIVSN